MKKVIERGVLLFFLYLLAGCCQIVENEGSPVAGSSNLLSITTSFSAEGGNFRSVLPEALNTEGLFYYLTAENIYTGEIILPKEALNLSPDNDNNSKGTISVENYPEDYYYFSLYAHTSELSEDVLLTENKQTVLEKLTNLAVLSSKIAVDTRWMQELKFCLTPLKIDVAGTLKLDFICDGWNFDSYSSKYSAEYTLTNISGEKESDGAFIPRSSFVEPQINTAIKSGYYSLEIKFSSKLNSSLVFSYEEGIYVLPNRITEASVKIPDIILLPPSAPQNFTAMYKKNPSYYSVLFNWNDTSNNELYYEFELIDISSAYDEEKITGTAADFELSGTKKNFSTLCENEIDYYESGSLLRVKNNGTGSLTLKLQYGYSENNSYIHRYQARLRAVNDGGESDWCYLNLSSPETQTLPEGYSAFSSDSKFICVEKS